MDRVDASTTFGVPCRRLIADEQMEELVAGSMWYPDYADLTYRTTCPSAVECTPDLQRVE